jgi:hypothetical protein
MIALYSGSGAQDFEILGGGGAKADDAIGAAVRGAGFVHRDEGV